MKPEWFAGRLRELRDSRGWTQQQLADASGMTLAAVQSLEQGRNYPEWPTVLLLCQALGVDCNSIAVEPKPRQKPGRGRPRSDVVQRRRKTSNRGSGKGGGQ